MKTSKLNNEEPKDFWNQRYLTEDTGWDLGQVSPSIKAYIDQLSDKNLRILIPGCGNAHEAEYLLNCGFTNITLIDIAPLLVENLQTKFKGNPNIKVLLGDFFQHQNEYDLILEQTFFCALNPALRADYAIKMNELLSLQGKLVGLLFATEFEKAGPPFGGNMEEYQSLFSKKFEIQTLQSCYNSFPKRQGNELFFILKKIGNQL
jgi:SAM-dependent methyltransferase